MARFSGEVVGREPGWPKGSTPSVAIETLAAQSGFQEDFDTEHPIDLSSRTRIRAPIPSRERQFGSQRRCNVGAGRANRIVTLA
jgi:hypothetical protein